MIDSLDTAIWIARMADSDDRRAAKAIYGSPAPPRRRDEGQGCQPDWVSGRRPASKPRTVLVEGLEYRLSAPRSNALYPNITII